MNETFVCYSRCDRAFVDLLLKALEEIGIDVWRDLEDIPGGVPWRQELLVALQAAHNFVYVLSPDSIASIYCNMEVDHALAMNKRIIPVVPGRIDGSEVRPSIQELNWIFFDNFEQGLSNLIKALEAPLGFSWGDRLDSKISVVSGDKPIKSLFLYRNQYVIGRNPSGGFARTGLIQVGDSAVSRSHCTLVRRDGRWLVADGLVQFAENGSPISFKVSQNGVKVWNQRLDPFIFRPLVHKDLVQLSSLTSLLYEELLPDRSTPQPDNRDTQADCQLEE